MISEKIFCQKIPFCPKKYRPKGTFCPDRAVDGANIYLLLVKKSIENG